MNCFCWQAGCERHEELQNGNFNQAGSGLALRGMAGLKLCWTQAIQPQHNDSQNKDYTLDDYLVWCPLNGELID